MSDLDEVQNHLFFSEMELEETRRERDDLESRLEQACDEIIELKDKLRYLERALEDVDAARKDSVLVEAFWRRAAEQALRLWDRSQDRLEELGFDA